MIASKDHRWAVLVVVAATLLTALPAGLPAQATGSIEGQVVDTLSGRPLPGVRVAVVGADLSAKTNSSGVYRLRNVPVGGVNLRIQQAGYVGTVERLTVSGGTVTIAHFRLTPLSIVLDELLVTGRSQRQFDRQSGASVGSIRPADQERPPAGTTTDLMAGRLSGVDVVRGTGQVGAGSRIQLRGPKSFILTNEPLVYVYGIRVPFATSKGISILDQFDPDAIDRIELLRGAAAAMRYGTGARNGVVLIYTKRGTPRRHE